ncbi:hypothetical protein BH10BAC4_BH10BAC4_22560 [soil metagenome]
MKNYLAINAFLIVSSMCYGQKCKFTIDKKDEFTGQDTKSIVNRIDNQYFTWTSSWIGGKYFIELMFVHGGEVHEAITRNDTVQIKLQNEKILYLIPVNDIQPVTRNIISTSSSTTGSYSSSHSSTRSTSYRSPSTRTSTATSQLTYYTPVFEVGREVFEDLSNSMITRLRINITGKPEDIDFLKRKHYVKGCERIMEEAKCILAVN